MFDTIIHLFRRIVKHKYTFLHYKHSGGKLLFLCIIRIKRAPQHPPQRLRDLSLFLFDLKEHPQQTGKQFRAFPYNDLHNIHLSQRLSTMTQTAVSTAAARISTRRTGNNSTISSPLPNAAAAMHRISHIPRIHHPPTVIVLMMHYMTLCADW